MVTTKRLTFCFPIKYFLAEVSLFPEEFIIISFALRN